MGRDFRLAAAAVRRALTRNTALVVASAPCFPHGVIDDVAGIAEARCSAGARDSSPVPLMQLRACRRGLLGSYGTCCTAAVLPAEHGA